MKSKADSSLLPAPPKPGLGSYFKSQPQIQLWCFHPNLGQRPHFRPDGEMRPGEEVKTRTNMSTCNEYLDSAQHVDLHLRHGSYVSPTYVQVFCVPRRQSSSNLQAGWYGETPTLVCVVAGFCSAAHWFLEDGWFHYNFGISGKKSNPGKSAAFLALFYSWEVKARIVWICITLDNIGRESAMTPTSACP